MRKSLKLGLGMAALLAAGPAIAADHIDGTTTGTGALADPSVDITDVYAWMSSDSNTVNLIMNVFPSASSTSLFSTTANYVFHTYSQASLLSTTSVQRDIICNFTGSTSPQTANCWVVNGTAAVDYASGNASAASAPLVSADSKMTIFAGLRDDPFFFNLAGFKNTTSAVAYASTQTSVVTGTDPTYTGCPEIVSAGHAVAGYLTKDCTGTVAGNDFFRTAVTGANTGCTAKPADVQTPSANDGLTGNVMSIVISVDKTLLTSGGATLSVWGATTH